MATELPKRIIHDWSTGELIITEIKMTQEEEVGEVTPPKIPES
jgi:hypothetical protein